jgi:hypothetical protein
VWFRITIAVMAGALGLLSGCVSASGTVKTRAANDFSCSEGAVTVKDIGANIGGTSYKAEGCGQTAVYDCSQSFGGHTGYECVPEGKGSR